MPTETEIKSVTRKIKALLAKTIEAGASEAEAMSAFTKAHEMLEQYQLNLSDLDLREEGTSHFTREVNHIIDGLTYRVAMYCEVKPWRTENRTRMHFLGIKSDVEFAEWLLTALADYVAGKEMAFIFGDNDGSGYDAEDYKQGCISRINERLKAEVEKREFDRQWSKSTGRDLVPLKNAMIDEAFSKFGIRLAGFRGRATRIVNADAFYAGKKAGDGVTFHRPVHDNRETQRRLK